VSRRSSREHRAQQTDALTIEAQAKRRLADEYAAQARGEIATRLDNLRPALFGSRANAARRNLHNNAKPERQV
jgi:ribosomal protein L29